MEGSGLLQKEIPQPPYKLTSEPTWRLYFLVIYASSHGIKQLPKWDVTHFYVAYLI